MDKYESAREKVLREFRDEELRRGDLRTSGGAVSSGMRHPNARPGERQTFEGRKAMAEYEQRRQQQHQARVEYGRNDHHERFIEISTQQALFRAGLLSERQLHPDVDLVDMTIGGSHCVRMARDFLALAGARPPPLQERRELFTRALAESDFPSLVENITHKALTMGYEQAPETWPLITRSSTTPGFKTFSRVQPPTLDPPLPTGENAEIMGPILRVRTASGESGQLVSYVKNGEITRELLVNDDLGSLIRTMNTAGRENARLIGDLAYSKMIANEELADGETLFGVQFHNNDLTSGAAPDAAQLNSMNALIQGQKGPASQHLNLRARILLAPANQAATLASLVASLNGTGPQQYIALTDSRLSGTAWYALEDPAITPWAEVVRLEGGNSPQRFEMVAIQGDGMHFRYGLDVAVVVTDFKPIARNAGA